MKTITFGTLKGGVGKTMLAFNVGGMLAQLKQKVLLIDGDLQGNLTNNIGIDRTRRGIPTLYDLYNVDAPPIPPEELVIKTPNERLPKMDAVAGSIFLHRAELRMTSVAGRESILKNYIEKHQNYFDQYDYIIIDTNPSMSIINQNAFLASDTIMLVSDVSMNALEGAQLFIALWEETRQRLRVADNIKAFIVNDYDGRNNLSVDFLEYIRTAPEVEDIRAIKMDTVIPRTVRITEAELAAMPISLYDFRSRGCNAITELIDELLRKGIL